MVGMAIWTRIMVGLLAVVLMVGMGLAGTAVGQSVLPTPACSPLPTEEGRGVPTGFTPTPAATRAPGKLEGSGPIEVTPVLLPAAGAEYADGWAVGFGMMLRGLLGLIVIVVVVTCLAQWFGWFDGSRSDKG